jgi:exodeoxyribonuclease VII large subunit
MSLRPVPAAAPPRPYTVSEILAEVAGVLRSTWRDVSVAGEIGSWSERGGHGYFTLKDKTGTLNGIIFASDLLRVKFRPEAGLEVVARGNLDLYPPTGKFQIRAFGIEPVGIGALQLAFEQLKAKLAAEGLFDKAKKRPIPLLSRRIGIVTSPTGAAIRDILNVLRRRFDGLAVTIYPVRVQGDVAAAEIAGAIRSLNRRGGFDVLIVARGGGSPEDLAPFNDERVARALAASAIPTISAVGHETDVTIADFVADLRAPTPSAAAEMVIQRKDDLARKLSDARSRFALFIRSALAHARARLTGFSRADGLLQFRYRLRDRRERIAQSHAALLTALERRPARDAARLARARQALETFPRLAELPRKRESARRAQALLTERVRRSLDRRDRQLRGDVKKLELLSPLAVLARGYSVAYREGSKRALRSASAVRIGDRVRVRLDEGEIATVVRSTGAAPPAGPLFAETAPEGETEASPGLFDPLEKQEEP